MTGIDEDAVAAPLALEPHLVVEAAAHPAAEVDSAPVANGVVRPIRVVAPGESVRLCLPFFSRALVRSQSGEPVRAPQRLLNADLDPSKPSGKPGTTENAANVLRMSTPGAARCTAEVPRLEKAGIASFFPVAATQRRFVASAPPGGRPVIARTGTSCSRGCCASRSRPSFPAANTKSVSVQAGELIAFAIDVLKSGPPKLPFTTSAPFVAGVVEST